MCVLLSACQKCDEPKTALRNSSAKSLTRSSPTRTSASVAPPATQKRHPPPLKITPVPTLLVPVESNVLPTIRRTKSAPPEPQECAGQSLQHASFTQQIIFGESGGWITLHLLPWLQAEIFGSPANSFCVTPTQAVQRGSRQSDWKVCLKNQTPGEVPPLSAPNQSGVRPLPDKDIPARAISPYKAKECTRLQPVAASDAARDVWERGRNDRNYDKAALFRENCLNTKRWTCAVECEEGERAVSRRRAHWEASVFLLVDYGFP